MNKTTTKCFIVERFLRIVQLFLFQYQVISKHNYRTVKKAIFIEAFGQLEVLGAYFSFRYVHLKFQDFP